MNPILTFVRNYIGQPLQGVPSEFTLWLGGILREAEEGHLVMDFEVRKDMTNPIGTLHGGVMAAIMDEMMGFMVFCMNNEYLYNSINLTVDFLENGKVGDTIRASTNVIRKGNRIINAECTLHNQHGLLLARSSSNLASIPIKVQDYLSKK